MSWETCFFSCPGCTPPTCHPRTWWVLMGSAQACRPGPSIHPSIFLPSSSFLLHSTHPVSFHPPLLPSPSLALPSFFFPPPLSCSSFCILVFPFFFSFTLPSTSLSFLCLFVPFFFPSVLHPSTHPAQSCARHCARLCLLLEPHGPGNIRSDENDPGERVCDRVGSSERQRRAGLGHSGQGEKRDLAKMKELVRGRKFRRDENVQRPQSVSHDVLPGHHMGQGGPR